MSELFGKIIVAILFGLLVFVSLARADNTGVSYIGIKHPTWPCSDSLTVWDLAPQVNFGTLIDDTFGKNYDCIERVLKIEKPKEVRFHAANCTCFPERGRKCHKDEIFAGLTQKQADAKIRAKDSTILNRYRVKLAKGKALYNQALLSPCMESGLSRQARQIMLSEAEAYFPKAQLFDNPFGDSCISGYGCEVHGDKSGKPRYTVDLDGISFNKINLTQFVTKNKKAIFALLWEFWMNCIDHHNPNFVSPPLRKCNPNGVVFRYLRELLKPNGMIPSNDSPLDKNDLKGCKKRGWNDLGDALWKQSDTWPGAVYISPRRFAKILIKKNGKTETFKHSGNLPKPDNRNIYRLNTPTWQVKDNSVIIGDGSCFVIEEPLLRKD